ncbi:hypothetical protein L13192_10454 [Pyrenophora tritici-repentis]|uniref:Secreted protein n=1 Tax=Pyrenophora tritici-repentis TaxID=45151 RepID=A0A922SZ87_9PLEO|nr:hypothetical protein Ptr86124_008679 [Pyrenophora tritici-repentis]KAI1665513.1 hypothetical protein L13192_10454 [Pyrenophora tritici-repentis]KAI1677655.1 hypothetical protein KJE20_12591 [Pyrenophora tritici-repentis]
MAAAVEVEVEVLLLLLLRLTDPNTLPATPNPNPFNASTTELNSPAAHPIAMTFSASPSSQHSPDHLTPFEHHNPVHRLGKRGP